MISDAPETAAPEAAPEDPAAILAARLDAAAVARLGRSLAVYPAAAAGCGGCGLEWAMLRSAAYGLARHGLSVVDHPAAADVLLVWGAASHALVEPLRAAHAAMGAPCWVVAVGACAIDGGPFASTPAVAGGLGAAIPVDLVVPGCPPTPAAILAGLETILAANTE